MRSAVVSKYPAEGIAILPDPLCDGGPTPTLEDIDLDGTPDTLVSKGNASIFGTYDREVKGIADASVVESQLLSTPVLMIDVDHDSKATKAAELAATVHDGKYDAEVALVHHDGADGGSDWIYYDTDNDGKFDLVLFVAVAGKEVTQAFRRESPTDNQLELDPLAVPGKILRYKTIFKDKTLGPKWKAIASKSFKLTSIED